MKTMLPRFLLLTGILFLACAHTLPAKPEYKQPRLMLAVQYLEGALKADDPAPLMRQAKEDLERVKSEKDGFRDRAIALIDAGLADAQAGKTEKLHGDITTALAAVQSAMAHH